MNQRIAFLTVFFLTLAAFGAPKTRTYTQVDQPIRLEKAGSSRLFVVDYAGAVTLIPSKTNDVVVRMTRAVDTDGDAGDLLRQVVLRTTNTNGTLEIRAALPPSKSDWAGWARGKNVPQARLEVFAPDTMSAEIYLSQGDVKVAKWRAPVTVTSQSGRLTLEDINSDVIVRSVNGSVKVENIRGGVNIENFGSTLAVTNVTGKFKMRTFSGEAKVKKVAGPLLVSSQKGPVTLSETAGPLEVQTGIAALHITDHRGALHGQSDTGSINARVSGSTDVKLSSVGGDLTVSVPRASQASVYLTSQKGDVNGPNSLESKRTANGKSLSGHLSGSEGGRVRLTSESGDVRLKQI